MVHRGWHVLGTLATGALDLDIGCHLLVFNFHLLALLMLLMLLMPDSRRGPQMNLSCLLFCGCRLLVLVRINQKAVIVGKLGFESISFAS